VTVLVSLPSRLPEVSRVDRWLYVGDDPAWRIAAEAGPLAGVSRIDAADLLQQKAWELREAFLEWAGDLGRRNDSLAWWSSQLAARNSYTRFYDRVCWLAAATEMLLDTPDDETTLAVCASAAVAAELARATGARPPAPSDLEPARRHSGAKALRAWARFAPGPLRSLPAAVSERARLSFDNDPRYRRRVLADRGLLAPAPFSGERTALLFTWIDRRSFDADGRFHDPHLGPLGRLLRAHGVEVAYVAQVLHGIPFAEAIDRLSASGERFLHPDAYLTLDDHRETSARAAAFAPEIPEGATVAGTPVAALAREFVEEQRPAQAGSLLVEAFVRRFADAGVRPERIIHTGEGHDWELTLAWTARRCLPDTQLIAYENLNMSRLALSMFPARAEHGLRPLPDRIVTNGSAFHSVLRAEGVPDEIVRTGCGLRHEQLWTRQPAKGPRTGGPLRILVATELALGASAELTKKAADAFCNDPSTELVVKCHPLLRRNDLLRLLPHARELRFDDRPMLELLESTDVLLYSYTSVGFEALALGVPPVFVRSESTLDLDQLEFAPDLRWQGRTPCELRSVVAEIAALDGEVLAAWRAKARAAAARAIAPVRQACAEAFL
jgi:hypothetical protein